MTTVLDSERSFLFPSLTGAGQVVAITSSNAQSAALAAGRYVMVSTTDIWFEQAANPVAVAATAPAKFLPAGTMMTFRVSGTSDTKIGAIQDSGAGNLSIYPVS